MSNEIDAAKSAREARAKDLLLSLGECDQVVKRYEERFPSRSARDNMWGVRLTMKKLRAELERQINPGDPEKESR